MPVVGERLDLPWVQTLLWNGSVLLAPRGPGVGMCWKDKPALLPCTSTTSPGNCASPHSRTYRNIKHLFNFPTKHPEIQFPSVPQHTTAASSLGLTWDGSLLSLVLLSTAQTVSGPPGEGRMKNIKPVSLLTILLCEE